MKPLQSLKIKMHSIWILIVLVTIMTVPVVLADETKIDLSANIVTPTELFVPVTFSGNTIPESRIILYNVTEQKIYIQDEVDVDGTFELNFVLDRIENKAESFELYALYKGEETQRLSFAFDAANYDMATTTHLVLSPIPDIENNSFQEATEIRLFAKTSPNSKTTFYIHDKSGNTAEYEVISDEWGFAEVRIGSGLPSGDFSFTVVSEVDGIQSLESNSIDFSVIESIAWGGYLEGQQTLASVNAIPSVITIKGIEVLLDSTFIKVLIYLMIVMLIFFILNIFQQLGFVFAFIPRKKKKENEECSILQYLLIMNRQLKPEAITIDQINANQILSVQDTNTEKLLWSRPEHSKTYTLLLRPGEYKIRHLEENTIKKSHVLVNNTFVYSNAQSYERHQKPWEQS